MSAAEVSRVNDYITALQACLALNAHAPHHEIRVVKTHSAETMTVFMRIRTVQKRTTGKDKRAVFKAKNACLIDIISDTYRPIGKTLANLLFLNAFFLDIQFFPVLIFEGFSVQSTVRGYNA